MRRTPVCTQVVGVLRDARAPGVPPTPLPEPESCPSCSQRLTFQPAVTPAAKGHLLCRNPLCLAQHLARQVRACACVLFECVFGVCVWCVCLVCVFGVCVWCVWWEGGCVALSACCTAQGVKCPQPLPSTPTRRCTTAAPAHTHTHTHTHALCQVHFVDVCLKGVGASTTHALWERGLLDTPAALYKLKEVCVRVCVCVLVVCACWCMKCGVCARVWHRRTRCAVACTTVVSLQPLRYRRPPAPAHSACTAAAVDARGMRCVCRIGVRTPVFAFTRRLARAQCGLCRRSVDALGVTGCCCRTAKRALHAFCDDATAQLIPQTSSASILAHAHLGVLAHARPGLPRTHTSLTTRRTCCSCPDSAPRRRQTCWRPSHVAKQWTWPCC
jgi:hypothetical protein